MTKRKPAPVLAPMDALGRDIQQVLRLIKPYAADKHDPRRARSSTATAGQRPRPTSISPRRRAGMT